jgi:hypothetical protein
MKRKRFYMAIAVLAAYIGIYVALSLQGQYYWHARGDLRFKDNDGSPGFSLYDTVVWLPKYLDFRSTRLPSGEKHTFWNIGGIIFLPLILLDRAVWHRTTDLIDEETTPIPVSG